MNIEQLRKEYEAWAIKEGMYVGRNIGRQYDSEWCQASWESFQAAAKSRDELIRKLVEASQGFVHGVEVMGDYPDDSDMTFATRLMLKSVKELAQALAAIEPYLTKEQTNDR